MMTGYLSRNPSVMPIFGSRMTDVLRLLYYVAGRIYYKSIEESGSLQAIDSEWLTVGADGDRGRGPPRRAGEEDGSGSTGIATRFTR